MHLSARNQLPGKVKRITSGPINAEVVITLAGGTEIVAVITRHSAKRLGLKRGTAVFAVVKSSDVMVGVGCGRSDCPDKS